MDFSLILKSITIDNPAIIKLLKYNLLGVFTSIDKQVKILHRSQVVWVLALAASFVSLMKGSAGIGQ